MPQRPEHGQTSNRVIPRILLMRSGALFVASSGTTYASVLTLALIKSL